MVLICQECNPSLISRLSGVGIRAGERSAYLLETNTVAIELVGVGIHANGRTRAAAHVHLADARDLGNFLRQDRVRRVIDVAPRMLSETSARIMIEKSAGLIFQ